MTSLESHAAPPTTASLSSHLQHRTHGKNRPQTSRSTQDPIWGTHAVAASKDAQGTKATLRPQTAREQLSARLQDSPSLFPLSRPNETNGTKEGNWSFPSPLPAPQMTSPAALSKDSPPSEPLDPLADLTGGQRGGYDLELIDRYLSLLTGLSHQQFSLTSSPQRHPMNNTSWYHEEGGGVGGGLGLDAPPPLGTDPPLPSMRKLGLDVDTLTQEGVPLTLISRMLRALNSNAKSFESIVKAEQARLAVMMASSAEAFILPPDKGGETGFGLSIPASESMLKSSRGLGGGNKGLSLSDRLLAYITGSTASIVEAMGGAPFSSMQKLPPSPPPEPHPSSKGVFVSSGPGKGRATSALIDEERVLLSTTYPSSISAIEEIDKAAEMAAQGNTLGLHRLLNQCRAAYQIEREGLLKRISHEDQRAMRAHDALEEKEAKIQAAAAAASELKMLLAIEKKRVKELESVAAEREEFARAKDAEVKVLRKELKDMERTWSAQLAEASDRVSEQINALQRQTEGQKALRSQYLVKVKESVSLQVKLDSESRRAAKCEAELEAFMVERDHAVQEAEKIKKWAEPLSVQLNKMEDLVKATEAKAFDMERRLEHEKAAHEASKREGHGIKWKIESARCQLADMYAVSTREIKKLSHQASEAAEKAMMLEAQLKDAIDLVRMRTQDAESARAFKKAARQQLEVVLVDFKRLEERSAINEVDAARAKNELTVVVAERDRLKDEMSMRTIDLEATKVENREQGERLAALAEFERDLERFKSKMKDLEATVSTLKEDKASLETEIEERKKEIERLASKEAELEVMSVEHANLKEKHKALCYDHDILHQSISVFKSRIDNLEKQSAQMKELSDQKTRLLEDERKQHTETKQMLKSEKENLAVLIQKEKSAVMASERAIKAESEAQAKAHALEISESKARSELKAAKAEAADMERTMREALVDRDWVIMMRGMVSSELQALTSRSKKDLERIQDQALSVKEGLVELQGQMAHLRPYSPLTLPLDGDESRGSSPTPPHSSNALESMDASSVKAVFDDLGSLLVSLDALITMEKDHCQDLARKVQGMDGPAREERKKASSEFWTTCLTSAKGSKEGLSQYIMNTSNGVRHDSYSPLAQLVPVGLLEEQASEIDTLKEEILKAKADKEQAKSDLDSRDEQVAAERLAMSERELRHRSRIEALEKDLEKLKLELRSKIAFAKMHEKISGELGKRVSDAEWQVAKAKERAEVLIESHGRSAATSYLVPLGRVDRATMTEGGEPLWGGGGGSGTVPPSSPSSRLQHYSGRSSPSGPSRPPSPGPALIPTSSSSRPVSAAVHNRHHRPSSAASPSLSPSPSQHFGQRQHSVHSVLASVSRPGTAGAYRQSSSSSSPTSPTPTPTPTSHAWEGWESQVQAALSSATLSSIPSPSTGAAPSAPALSAQETLDAITRIYREKARDDSTCTSANLPPRSLPRFLALYFMQQTSLGPQEALLKLTSLVEGVRMHAGQVYEISTFGKMTGIIGEGSSAGRSISRQHSALVGSVALSSAPSLASVASYSPGQTSPVNPSGNGGGSGAATLVTPASSTSFSAPRASRLGGAGLSSRPQSGK